VISALIGIAIERKQIPDVRTPIAAYFPELAMDPDPRKRTITIEDLLTMRSGLEGTSNVNYGAWVNSRNWVQHALARPMFAAPGAAMEYSTGNSHLLSAILTKATGTSTWQFANESLFRPLGSAVPQWPRDPQGIYFGGNDMLMTSRQPERWVAKSCEGRAREFRPGERTGRRIPTDFVDPMRDRKYGYSWWVHELGGHDTCFAWGYGGQYIFVVPDLDMVIVTTASSDVSEERRGHRQQVFDILLRDVVQPLSATR
jgi:CubicO group peptidase (beta-lactamase class C family)